MKYFNKLSGFRRSPSGLEWRLLRKMPMVFLVGTVVPGLVSLLSHSLLPKFSGADVAAISATSANIQANIQWIDIMMISVVTLFWTWAGTLTIGCIIVVLMKGPAYVADAYPLPDSEKPTKPDRLA